MEVWNGKLLLSERVTLTNPRRRKRFAEEIVEKVPDLPLPDVQQRLLELEAALMEVL